MTNLLCWMSLLLFSAVIAQDSPSTNDLGAFEQSYKNAVMNHDLDGVLSLYHSENEDLVSRTRRDYTDWYSLDPDPIEVRFGESEMTGDTLCVAVFHKSYYTLHDLPQVRAAWSTLKLRRIGGQLKIVGDEVREYLRPRHTNLIIDLYPDSSLMRGTCSLELEQIKTGQDNILLSINRGLDISSITVNGESRTDFIRRATIIEISNQNIAKNGQTISVEVGFFGKLFNESEHAGFSQVNLGTEGSFASWVTDWYPRNGSGPTKSPGRIQITAPAGLAVVSNGRSVSSERLNGRTTHVFEVDVAQDFTFAAGDYYHQVTDVNGVQLGVYFLEGGPEKVDLYLTKCAELLQFQMETYGMYPFGSYLLVEIPSAVTGNLGGSSEQGMNLYPTGILSSSRFNLPIISHELGHSWWGNWVKSADGSIISEGLAQYTAVLSVEHFLGSESMRKFLKEGLSYYPQSAMMYFEQFAGPGAQDFPIGVVSAANGPALHTLADVKGHFVYQMLSDKIGRDSFMRGLRRAINVYANKDMRLDDLFRIWEEESGQDLRTFRQQWFYRAGAPEFALTYELVQNGEQTNVTGRIEQKRDLYDVEAELAVYSAESRTLHRLTISEAETPVELTVENTVDSVVFDPDYKIFRFTPAFERAYLLNQGVQERVRGANDSAATTLSEYLQYFPESLQAHYQRARAIQQSGDNKRAVEAFDSVLVFYTDHKDYSWTVPWTYYNLGKLYLALGDTAAAVAMLDTTLGFPEERAACEQSRILLDSLHSN